MQGNTPSPTAVTVESDTSEVDQLKRRLRALKRRWPVVVVMTFVGALLGWVTTPAAPTFGPRDTGSYFRATTTLIAEQQSPAVSTSPQIASSGNTPLAQAAFLVTTGDVPNQIADRLRLPVEQVREDLRAAPIAGVDSLAITAIGTDPNEAATLADTAAEQLIKSLAEANTQRYNQARDDVLKRLDALKATRADLESQIRSNPGSASILNAQLDSVVNQYRLTYEQFQQLASQPAPSSGLRTIEAASPVAITGDEYRSIRSQNLADPSESAGGAVATTSTAPSSSKAATSSGASSLSAPARAVAGGLLGLALGLGLVLLLDMYDTRLRRRVEVEGATLLPVITEIPPLSRSQQHDFGVVVSLSPRSRAAEAYRIIRTSLLFSWSDQPRDADGRGHVVMVTSPSPNEGKTTTVANLATVLAEGGLSVLVVNCDFRRPRIQKYLEDPTQHDERPTGVIGPEGPIRVVQSRIGHVDLVAGFGEHNEQANPLEIVATQRQVVQSCRGEYDIILLDTAPFLTTNDASELLSETDVVLLVVRNGKTKREVAARTAELLRRLESNPIGVVFNGSNDSPAAEYYYHYYLDESGKRRKDTVGNGTSKSANGNGAGATGMATAPAGSSKPDVN